MSHHELSFGERLERVIWGFFVAGGYWSLWIGIARDSLAFLSIGIIVMILAFIQIVLALSNLKKIKIHHSSNYPKHRNHNRRRHNGY